MEYLSPFILFLERNLIQCLPLMLILIWLTRFFYKKNLNSIKIWQWTSALIIGFSLLQWIQLFVNTAYCQNAHTLLNRSHGVYSLMYWIMIASQLVIPHLLWIKKWQKSFSLVLLVSFLMNIGNYLEKFIIITTSLHRDYQSPSDTLGDTFAPFFISFTVQSIVLAVIFILAFQLYSFVSNKRVKS